MDVEMSRPREMSHYLGSLRGQGLQVYRSYEC